MPVDRARADGSVRKRGNSLRGEARRHLDKMATSNVQEHEGE
jgi:hypothetical protein